MAGEGYYETLRDEFGDESQRWVNTGDQYLDRYDPATNEYYRIVNPNYRPPKPMSQYSGSARTDVYWTDINPAPSNDPNYQPTMGWYVPEYERISANMKVPEKGKYEVKENLYDNSIGVTYSKYTHYEDGKPVYSWTEYPEVHGSSGGIGGFLSGVQRIDPIGNTFGSPVAKQIEEAISPIIPVATMGALAAMTGGAATAAGLPAAAAGAVSGTTAALPSALEEKSLVPLAGGAALGAIGGGLLGGSAATAGEAALGDIPVGSSLAEMEALYPSAYMPQTYEAGLMTTLPQTTGDALVYGSPEFFAAGEELGLTPTATASLVDTSLGGASAMGLTNTPIQYGSTEMMQQGEALGLTPEQTLSLTDTSLGGQSANDLADATTPLKDAAKKALQQYSKGLLSQGMSVQTPSFNISFNPLTAKTWNYTPTNFATTAATQAGGSTALSSTPFTGIGLLREQEKKKLELLPYLRDYLA